MSELAALGLLSPITCNNSDIDEDFPLISRRKISTNINVCVSTPQTTNRVRIALQNCSLRFSFVSCTVEVKVHFFGDSMAILYGSESAVHTEADGRKHTVKLTWTDTWLKRHGTWQVVAAQDMPSEMQ